MFEPKILYRTAIDDVPTADYKIEIGKAEVVREGRRAGRQILWISFTLYNDIVDPCIMFDHPSTRNSPFLFSRSK